MSDVKKLAGQTFVYGIPTILGRFLNYFLVPLHTYNIGAQEYGQVSELYAYAALMQVLLTYGMETAFFRYSQDYDKKIVFNTALLSLMLSTGIFLLITFSFLSPICSAMEYSGHPSYISLFLIILSLDALRAIPYDWLRRENRAARFALVKSIDIFTNIIFNVIFIVVCPYLKKHGFEDSLSWFNENDLVVYIFISNLIASIASFIMLIPQFRLFRLHFDSALLRKMLAYGFPVMIGGLAGMVNETFDRVALRRLVRIPENITTIADANAYKIAQIGIYGACYKLATLVSLFIQAFKFAAEPFFFSKMKQQDAKKSYASVMSAFVIFLCIVFLGVTGYLDIFQYFMGRDYRQGLAVVPILLLANIFLGIYYNLSIWYKVTDKTKWGAYISIFGAIITLVGNFLLVPLISYVGAAITTLVCYFSISALCYLIGQKYYPIAYDVKRLCFYIIFALILYSVMYIVRVQFDNVWLNIALATILIAIYAFVAYKKDIARIIKER